MTLKNVHSQKQETGKWKNEDCSEERVLHFHKNPGSSTLNFQMSHQKLFNCVWTDVRA